METMQIAKLKAADETTVTPLGVAIESALGSYFSSLGDQAISNLYKIVRDEVEEALLRFVMKFVRNNQSKAAHLLGVSRTTLRKKLKEFDLL